MSDLVEMVSLQHLQETVFEFLEFADPIVAAALSGFVVLIGGVLYLTPAGMTYLRSKDHA